MMKKYRSTLAIALLTAIAILGTLGFGAQNLAAENAGFSLDTLKGEYILTEHGTAGAASGVAAIGRMTFDGNGGVFGWMTVQSAGSNATTTFTGTYAVSPDGSGTLKLIHTPPVPVADGAEAMTTTATYKFLAFGAGSTGLDLRAIRSENGLAVSADLTRSQLGTVASGLKGAYIFSEEGTLGAATALAGLGLITFDGNGRVSGWETVQVAQRTLVTTFVGTYGFESGGIGTMNLVHVLPGLVQDGEEPLTASAKYRFLVKGDANGVTELRAIRAENGIAVTSSFKSQSR